MKIYKFNIFNCQAVREKGYFTDLYYQADYNTQNNIRGFVGDRFFVLNGAFYFTISYNTKITCSRFIHDNIYYAIYAPVYINYSPSLFLDHFLILCEKHPEYKVFYDDIILNTSKM